MSNVTMQGPALVAARTLTRRPGTADGLPQFDPEVAKHLKETREEAAQAKQVLDKAKVDVRKQRKAAAQEKLGRINEALRMLRMVGGDPRTMAREGARLSRELAAAVKEYKAASEGGSAADGAPPATQTVPAADAAPAGPEADGAPVSEGGGEDATEHAEAQATEGAAPAQPGTAAEGATGEKDAEGGTEEKDAEASDGFADQARVLAKKLKAHINQQKERLQAAKGDGSEQAEKDVRAALDELRQTDGLLSDLPGASGSTAAVVDILI